MNEKSIPKKMKIGSFTYEVRVAWAGKLELAQYGGPVEYTTSKPHPVLHPGTYHVNDKSGNKVGEFAISTFGNVTYSGCVTGLEF